MKRKLLPLFCITLFVLSLSASPQVTAMQKETPTDTNTMELKVKITIGDIEVIADLENNATSRAFLKMAPLTLPMLNAYGREVVYRFPDPLPADGLRSDEYKVGDIVYWPPRHSFVILYKQNGEKFSRQQVGHIDADLSFLDGIGDVDVTFEPVK